ncbi:Cation-transporting ATPase CA1 [Tetrabaena socialis]|uniref:Cation-transporting ATPase CA1 n=1 Tax=Tetrabaena socialis TaxID=47790 RepID=A0A2J8A2D6_9CHLO|nr:Cation-transporting ATPase CA1 [Tetrabaena socialis]|eukprot:PNH06672.1 Cation-transporting ATPase CA1 [Tetrabaena socialis]
MNNSHAVDVAQVAAYLSVDLDAGLSDSDVFKARSRYGRNELAPEEGTPLWKLILKQFDDLLVKILLAAAVADFIIAMSDGDGILGALVEPCVIILILIANGEGRGCGTPNQEGPQNRGGYLPAPSTAGSG